MLTFITVVAADPLYIEIQYKTFKKFVKGEYEFIVFNDCKKWKDYSNFYNENTYQKIVDICKKYNIKLIDIENEHHKLIVHPSDRVADSMNFVTRYMKDNPKRYLLIDSDMFLSTEFDTEKEYTQDIVITPQRRKVYYKYLEDKTEDTIYYPWNGFFYIDSRKDLQMDYMNWDPYHSFDSGYKGYYNYHLDTGGKNFHWLNLMTKKRYPENYGKKYVSKDNKILMIQHNKSLQWDINDLNKELIYLKDFFINDPRNKKGKFFSEVYDGKFLHFRSGSNWRQDTQNYDKTLKLLYDLYEF